LWVVLYVAAVVPVVLWRLGRPLRSALRHRLWVTGVVREGPSHVSVYVTGRHLDELRAEAGQHFRWRFLTVDNWWQAHPYSLSAVPDGTHLRITAKSSGDHSSSLAHLRRTTKVLVEGPYGAFTRMRRTKDKVLLIAGGVGITPLRALFEELPARPGDLTLLYRVSRVEDVVLADELDAIATAKGATVRYAIGPRAMVPDPLSPDALAAVVDDLAGHDVYVCGPAGMTAAAVRSLRTAGVPRSQIHTEDFVL
jgi:ferredoxin-NADP reductase